MKRWKKIVTYRWRSKLMSLLLATIIWFLVRQMILDSSMSPVEVSPTHR